MEKVMLKLYEININSIEITELDLNEDFKVLEDYELVTKIGYSKYDDNERIKDSGEGIFDKFD
jgi:hypothetical protein